MEYNNIALLIGFVQTGKKVTVNLLSLQAYLFLLTTAYK